MRELMTKLNIPTDSFDMIDLDPRSMWDNVAKGLPGGGATDEEAKLPGRRAHDAGLRAHHPVVSGVRGARVEVLAAAAAVAVARSR
jgi:hypothetical protein